MSSIPCIANKCLKYPACKNKHYISCEVLFSWLDNERIDREMRTQDVGRLFNRLRRIDSTFSYYFNIEYVVQQEKFVAYLGSTA